MAEYSVPGLAIALTVRDSLLWAAGFGVTRRGGRAVTPETVFQAASLSKPVFAYLVERIAVERGWSFTDRIGDWSRPGGIPAEWLELTVEALLSHTSGLRYDPNQDRLILDDATEGSWSYSGPGYVLVQRALESAEQADLEQLATTEVFEPWALASMTFVEPDVREVAAGHDRAGVALGGLAWSEANAASSLSTNVVDYARFMVRAAYLEEGTSSAWDHLTRPRVQVREDLGLLWGAGWALEEGGRGLLAAFHWGSNPGFKSFALIDPARGMGLAILTNGDNGLELVERIVAILDEEPHRLFEFYMLHPDD